jgi:MFS family permease
MTINFLVMAFGSFGWGAASDRWGARVVTLCGAVLLGAALTLASRPSSLPVPAHLRRISSARRQRLLRADDRDGHRLVRDARNLAVSLVSAGMGMAPLTISPLASWLITHYGWRAAMFWIGMHGLGIADPAALFVRRPPAAAAGGRGAATASPTSRKSAAR